MNKVDIDDFIQRYECLYYPDAKGSGKEEYKNLLENRLNIKKLNGTDYRAEEKVMEQLHSSIFDEIALAWKAGKVGWKNKQLIISDSFEKGEYYINGYGGKINKYDFQTFCHELKSKKEQINNYVDNENWKEAYKTVMEISPKNIGPVYIINALFFLTGGKAPIYDVFAHKAVKALLLNISPSEVYMGGNPDKHDIDNATAMYLEYILLLKMIFKDVVKIKGKDDMFITRELDRALWVYGHSNLPY